MSTSLVELMTRDREPDSIPRSGPFAIRPVVVDANVFAEDVYHTVFKDHSALLDTAGLGTVRLFTPAHVYGKVYRVLGEMAYGSRAGMLAKAVEVWESKYLPIVRFVDMDMCPVDDARVAAVGLRDLEDEPVGRLAVLLSPSLLLSRDAHLDGLGMAGGDWVRLAVAGRDAMLPTQAAVGVSLPAAAITVGVQSGVDFLRERPSWRIPVLIILLGVVGLIAWGVWRADRTTWAESLGKAVNQASDALKPVIDRYNEAKELLARAMVIPALENDQYGQLVRTLAVSPRPLLMREIATALASAEKTLNLTAREVGQLLRTRSCFFRFNDARWQLGFFALPRRPLNS
jgi:hypothetical protein